MKLFIMRHGEAEPNVANDAQRELTTQGRYDVAQIMTRCAQELGGVDVIWSSPYVRAQQTAQIVSSHLSKEVVTKDFLPPNGNPDQALSALGAESDQTVLVVSHQPLVGVLVDDLAGLEPGRYRMGTSALAALCTDVYANGCFELLWLQQPITN